jgi:fibronectin-binding autotransporter adhesin
MNKLLLLSALLLHSTTLLPSTQDWKGGISGNWNANANWDPSPFPNGIDEIATFLNHAPSPLPTPSVTLGADITIGTTLFDLNGDYTISSFSNSLTFDVSTGSAAITVTNTIGNGSHTISCPVILADPLIVTQGSTGTFTISGFISETTPASLTKAGSGTLLLQGSNSYSNGTFINAGTLTINNNNRLGSLGSSLNFGNGTLRLTASTLIPSTRSGSITGSASIDTVANTVALAGSFSGSGSLTKLGTGTLILAGTNSYVGPTTISNGTLIGNTNSLPANIVVGAGTSLVFLQSDNGVYADALSGSGSFTKTGNGTLQITGNSPAFTGPITLSQGELKVNGSLENSSLSILAGTILSGIGSVGPTTVSNGGSIQPGNSIGSITINGALNLLPGSSITIETSPSSSDQIFVNGTATLTGGQLIVAPEPGFYGFETSYTILTSTSLGGTSFASFSSTDPNFIPELSYTTTDAVLLLRVPQPFAALTSNNNGLSLASNIQESFKAGALSSDLFNVVNAFTGQSLSTVTEALDQLSPAPYSNLTELQIETSSQLISLFHRFPILDCNCIKPSRLWFKPSANALKMKDHNHQLGFHSTTWALAAGFDTQVLDQLTIGVGAAWNRSHLNWNKERGSGTINGFYGAGYADYQIERVYLGAALLAGTDFCDTSRNILFNNRIAKADYHSFDLVAQLKTAYLFGSSKMRIYPYANFDFLYLNYDALTEEGAEGVDLHIQSRTASTFRTEAGATFQAQFKVREKTVCLSPLVSLGWVNMCPIQRDAFTANFVGSATSFSIEGWDRMWNLLSLNTGLSTSYKCFDFSLDYHLEMSASLHPILLEQQGNATLSWRW